MLRSRILAMLAYRNALELDEIEDDLAARANAMGDDDADYGGAQSKVRDVALAMQREGLIARDELTGVVTLTPEGRDLVDNHSKASALLGDQFKASLESRAAERLAEGDQRHVAELAETFLSEAVKRRSLGVVLALRAPDERVQEFHIVALLQSLPQYLEQAADEHAAMALSQVVRDVLSDPAAVELEYLGLALQAQFGVHLLGFDQDTLRARIRELAASAFLIDSNTLIHFLARSCVGHRPATMLIDRLTARGAAIFTTDLLVGEVAEHARWAATHAGSGAVLTSTLYEAATGRAGHRLNAFLEGYLKELEMGTAPAGGFRAYLTDVLALPPKSRTVADHDIAHDLKEVGVETRAFREWDGFDEILYTERDEVQEKIADRRRARDTFTHDRQVRAEAEVLLVVRKLRAKDLHANGRDFEDAYFISNTRIIDELDRQAAAVTMRAESALHLLATLNPVDLHEVDLFSEGLLAEIATRGAGLVNQERLAVSLSPLISASRDRLEEELTRYRGLIADNYGEDAAAAYSDLDDLAVPIVVESLYAQRAMEFERRAEEEKRRADVLAGHARELKRDQEELDRLRASKKLKDQAGRSAKRAAASRKGRRRRK
jgi:hypothetical protein